MSPPAEVVILGAGPTGCALGAYLARRGTEVTIVEAVEHPESVVGESMLPESRLVLEELDIDMSGFLVKHGAVFCDPAGDVRFDFADADMPRWTHAWQVQREVFDQRLRAAAVRDGCRIVYTRALAADVEAGVLTTSDGPLRAPLLIDCGGRDMWLATRLGLRVGDATLRNAAIGTRMKGVRHVAPDEPGDITICRIEGGWLWIIPFGDGVASVGAVMSPSCPLTGTAEERLAAAIASSPPAQARLAGAERVLPLRGLRDFTASASRFSGPGFALCGDAATFIDPVFSSGVLLGLRGARELATALHEDDLDGWEARYREAGAVFRRVIDCWYADEFMAVALAPAERQKPYFRKGIVSLLAGDVFDPARTAPRRMAQRMPELARMVRGLPAGA